MKTLCLKCVATRVRDVGLCGDIRSINPLHEYVHSVCSILAMIVSARRIKLAKILFAALLLNAVFCVGIGRTQEPWQPADDHYYALALSPDRQLILGVAAYFDSDSFLRLFDTGTDKAKTYPTMRTLYAESAAFSPDGRYLAAPSNDRIISIGRVETHKISRLLKVQSPVFAVAFSADGTTLASSHQDHTIRLWNMKTGRNVATLTSQKQFIFSLAFSRDGTRLAAGALKGHCEIWDVPERTLICNLEGHTNDVGPMMFSPNGARLVTASGDKTAKIWNVATGRELLTLRGHTGRLLGVAFSATTNRVVTSSSDNTVRVWDANTGKELQQFKDFVHGVSIVDFSLDEKTLLACDGIKLKQLPLATSLTN